ncbi:MAG: hypothetical protein OHK0046_30280 [Anaerolineae bacterium]
MPVSSPNEIFSDFFSQLPAALIVMVCGSLFLLFLAFSWFAFFKPRRNRRRAGQTVTATPAASVAYADPGDLPDLDDLLNLPAAAPRRQGKAPIVLNTGETVEADEVLAVLRDAQDGRLIVQMANIGYRTLANTPEMKKTFVKLMRELSTIIEDEGAAETAPAPAQRPAAPPAPVPAPEPPARSAARPAGPPPPADTTGRMPGDLPRFELDESVKVKSGGGLFSRAKYEAVPVPEVNIAASIEAYLQHKLRFTPEYNQRAIHVHSAPDGGVRIQVDDTFYDAVSDVADAEVREFLATTIQEWQERQ